MRSTMDSILRKLIGAFVGKCVLPAQMLPIQSNTWLRKIYAYLYLKPAQVKALQNAYSDFYKKNETKTKDKLEISRFFVESENGIELDTVKITPRYLLRNRKAVVYGWGRSDCYEKHLEQIATDVLNLQAEAISFNYRGIGYSTGQPYKEEDVIEDYCRQVRRLVQEEGVNPENISCYGHSLGGAIATLAVDKLRNEGYPVSIYNDRSFHRLVDAATGVYFEKERPRKVITTVGSLFLVASLLYAFLPATALGLLKASGFLASTFISLKINWTYPLWDKTIGSFLNWTMKSLMHYGQWVMDVAPVFDNLPYANKSYTVTKGFKKNTKSRSGLGEKYQEGTTRDRVIHHKHSNHVRLHEHKKRKTTLKEHIQKAYSLDEKSKYLSELRDLSDYSKMTGGDHMDPPRCFVSRYDHEKAKRRITGQERFYHFVDKSGQHVQADPIKYKVF